MCTEVTANINTRFTIPSIERYAEFIGEYIQCLRTRGIHRLIEQAASNSGRVMGGKGGAISALVDIFVECDKCVCPLPLTRIPVASCRNQQMMHHVALPGVSLLNDVSFTSIQPMLSNVSICAMEVYVPRFSVSANDLEVLHNVQGKYTSGIGMLEYRGTGCDEDPVSMALTSVSRMMQRHGIDWNTIGWLGVGTESLTDRSKSIKSNLMQLFESH